MKILILTLVVAYALGFNHLQGKVRKSEDHGGYCEMEFTSEDDSEYRDEHYYGWDFGLTQTDRNEGEFLPGNTTGLICTLGGDHDHFEDYDIVNWKYQTDLRCFKFRLFGGSMLLTDLVPGEDYFVDERCFGGFEYFSEINEGCKLYWKPEFLELKSTLKTVFAEDEWDDDPFYGFFNGAIDNDGGNEDSYLDAYTLDGDECLKGGSGFASTFSLIGLLSVLLFT